MPNVLLVVTGSVAAIKVESLVGALQSDGRWTVRVVVTRSARHFVERRDNAAEDGAWCGVEKFTDDDEWAAWNGRGDRVLHIDLRSWADVLLFAPLSANTLAKLAQGMADNLATCVARAWPWGRKPVVIAPAMNTEMWAHPATMEHIATLRRWGGEAVVVVEPVSKTLACGDVGKGALAPVESIVSVVHKLAD